MAENTLPAKVQNVTRAHGLSPMDHVQPGTWWRLTGKFEELEDRDAPDHGLIFLMSDIRVIDGEIHTVILHEHPRFGTGTFKVLLGDLLTEFAPEPDGEELRETELNAVMQEIQGVTREMAAPPGDDQFLRALPTPENRPAGENRENRQGQQKQDNTAATQKQNNITATALVPKVLLPGGDINAAQQKIETAMAVIEARKTWIEERTEILQQHMNLVANFQTEKVAIGTAGIVEQQKRAEKTLGDVRTIRLWLGEEQFFQTLVQGKGAEPDEPLHFMQRMLYLDEEIYIHDRLNGLTGDDDDLGKLPRILSENPDLVTRMLPHPRCVVITRARRNTRNLASPAGLPDVMSMLEAIQDDKRIQILIRNGDQVHLVAADDITSKAERLFPSQAEINAIFTVRSGYYDSGETRMITPHDIEYSDKRADHDSRALFYKRVLLIIWGLAEREGILGDFIGTGVNWLEEVIHNKAFRFVHDEEQVLSDGRLPVREFLAENRAVAHAGSRVMVDWRQIVDEDTAPQIHEEGFRSHHRKYRKVDLVEDFGTRIVEKRDNALTVKCPVRRHTYSNAVNREYNTPVKLAWSNPSGRGMSLRNASGFLVLDGLRSEDLTYYFESRIQREHYLQYLHLFDRARTFLTEEEARCDSVVELLGNEGIDRNIARSAVTLLRGARKWVPPDPARNMPELRRLCTRIQDVASAVNMKTGMLFADLTAGGNLEIGMRRDISVFGRKIPCAEIETYTFLKSKGWTFRKKRPESIDACPGPGRLRLRNGISSELLEKIHHLPVLLTNMNIIRSVTSDPENQSGIETILEIIGNPGGNPVSLLGECKAWSYAQSGSKVSLPRYSTLVGHAFDEGHDNLYRLEIYVDPVHRVFAGGHEDEIRAFVRGTYRNPDHGHDNIRKDLETLESLGDSPWGMRATKVIEFSDITRDPARGVVHVDHWNGGVLTVSTGKSDEMIRFPGSLREAFVNSIFHGKYGYSMLKKPDAEIELEKRKDMEKIHFAFFEGCEDIVKDITGYHVDSGPVEDLNNDRGNEDEPNP